MPLLPTVLKSHLQDIIENVPPDQSSLAQAWADAMQSYASGIVPACPGVGGAAATLKTALEAALVPLGMAPNPGVSFAFAAFAGTVAGGMVPPGAPPPSPLVLFGSVTDDPSAAADAMSAAVHSWMITGQSSTGSAWS